MSEGGQLDWFEDDLWREEMRGKGTFGGRTQHCAGRAILEITEEEVSALVPNGKVVVHSTVLDQYVYREGLLIKRNSRQSNANVGAAIFDEQNARAPWGSEAQPATIDVPTYIVSDQNVATSDVTKGSRIVEYQINVGHESVVHSFWRVHSFQVNGDLMLVAEESKDRETHSEPVDQAVEDDPSFVSIEIQVKCSRSSSKLLSSGMEDTNRAALRKSL